MTESTRTTGRDPILTIGIPTFNGERFISQAIATACREAVRSPVGAVEILVCDNASEDSTPEIIRASQERYPELAIRNDRNSCNLGGDRNIDLVIERARGKYVWLLADDDYLTDGALSFLLPMLSRDVTYALVLCNWSMVDDKGNTLIQVCHKFSTEELSDCNRALVHSEFAFGLLSSIILERKIWNEVRSEGEFLNPPGFNFLYLAAKMMTKGTTLLVGETLVCFRQYMKRWNTKNSFAQIFEIYYHINYSILERLAQEGFSRQVVEGLIRKGLKRLAFDALVAKVDSMRFGIVELRRLTRNYGRFLVFWAVFPVLLIPRRAVAGMRIVLRYARSVLNIRRGSK